MKCIFSFPARTVLLQCNILVATSGVSTRRQPQVAAVFVSGMGIHLCRNATDLDAFTKSFEGRLMALNRAHDLLTARSGGRAPA